MKSRLVRDGLFGPDLSLADTEHIFFVLLIDFDFPAIEVGLEHLNRIGSRIGDQQGSGLAIEPMPVIVIGQRGDDDQAEGPALSARRQRSGSRADFLDAELRRSELSKASLSQSVKGDSARDVPAWITFGIDGKFVYLSSGDVIDAATKRAVAGLQDEIERHVDSEKMVELLFFDSKLARTVDPFGVGQVPRRISK